MNARSEKSVKNEVTFDFDHEVYADVAAKASLVEVKLTEANYSIKLAEFFSSEKSAKDFKHMFGGNLEGVQYEKEVGVAVGGFSWTVELKSGRSKALKLKCRYVLIYDGLFDCDASHVEFYFAKLARFTTYPYFRSTFASLTSDSGLCLEPLPTLRERVD